MKSFSTFCGAPRFQGLLVSALLLGLVLLAGPGDARRQDYSAEALVNVSLGPEMSQWLVGPIARMASRQEIADYLALKDDEAAAEFIEVFWQRRAQGTRWPEPTPREVFEERAEEADKRFGEAAYPGRRTDRGAVYVLYGEPTERDYEISPRRGEGAIEVWAYGREAGKGLDDVSPAGRRFRFQKVGRATRFYDPRRNRGR